jgi:uncharacterized membrane protein
MPDSRANQPNMVHKLEMIVSWLLRIGVFSSLVIITTGTIITFLHHPNDIRAHTTVVELLDHHNHYPRNIHDDLAGVEHFHGRSIVILGLLVLIATPVLRVAVTIVAFAIQRDRIFVLITSIVLLLLLLSFALGKAGG